MDAKAAPALPDWTPQCYKCHNDGASNYTGHHMIVILDPIKKNAITSIQDLDAFL